MDTSSPADSQSSADSQCHSLGRFLYTQNPFYLISCGFVMYGLQVVAASLIDQYSRASFLTTGLAFYTLLMAMTAIAVIRWGKVWEDARSILLVIMIGQVAFSVAVDELCLSDRQTAAWFLIAGGVGTFLITELVLQFSRIRFAAWYRLAYYAMMIVFYSAPWLASHFRAQESELANWSALLFSIASAGALLLLVPAVHGGRSMTANNGTPWRWPLFPLSAFLILVVLAGVRSHAIWMAFGSLRGEVSFEPLLLMPLLLAATALSMEELLRRNRSQHAGSLLGLSPLLLVCGLQTPNGRYSSQALDVFEAGLRQWGGSTMTVAIVLMIAFFLYAWGRRVPGALSNLALMVFALGVFGQEPASLRSWGLEQWMFAAIACLVWFVRCQQRDASEWRWLWLITMVSFTILLVGKEHRHVAMAVVLASLWIVTMLMFVGWCFDTVLAYKIRTWVAYGLMLVLAAALSYHFFADPIDLLAGGALVAAIVFFGYALAVRRLGWIYLAVGSLLAVFLVSLSASGDTLGIVATAQHHWQLKTGGICFCVGVMITSTKTKAFKRMRVSARKRDWRRGFVRGF